MNIRTIMTLCVGICVSSVGMKGHAEEIQTVNAYYFGNSFLENSMPGLHPLLGKSAGKEWNVTASIYAGIPIWCHMNYLTVKPRLDDLNRFNAAAPKWDRVIGLDIVLVDDAKDGVPKSMVVWRGTKDNATDPSQFGSVVLDGENNNQTK